MPRRSREFGPGPQAQAIAKRPGRTTVFAEFVSETMGALTIADLAVNPPI